MRKLIAYPLTIIHISTYVLLLVIFHPIQVITYNLFGSKAHKAVVDILNVFLLSSLYILFCRFSFNGLKHIPKNKPLIIVSNHQSLYDITPVILGFRKHNPKFISKKELGYNIPSISYNLKKGGSVLIDRKNGSQSIKQILMLGRSMEKHNCSACIFPEGTRSKTGDLRKFQVAGFKTLLKASPSALIVPFAIDGNHKLHKWGGLFPLNFGINLKYTALKPINRSDYSNDEELLEAVREKIKEQLSIDKAKTA
ncbi:MAG: lysophospholipid acyltransferase family protein [Salinivirgaceae bacterium]|jgi:1-acyl-sn-glycerol-3-phosphate acyltransferase|nr:lysophospholipid acyltransferase family protein [Salinivirgaceae bacterium]